MSYNGWPIFLLQNLPNNNGTPDLQTVYNESTNPEIITASSQGALTVQQGVSNANNTLEVNNLSGSPTWYVTGAGAETTQSIVVQPSTGQTLVVNSTTNATNQTNGSVVLYGGLSVTKDIWCNSINVSSGSLGATGTTFNYGIGSVQLGSTGPFSTSQTENSFFGVSAGSTGGSVDYCTAIGYQSQYASGGGVTSQYNTSIGASAIGGGGLSSASYCVAVGSNAGSAIGSGNWNTLVGHGAGSSVTSGTGNTVLGWSSGELVTTGSKNTILGSAGGLTLTGSNNILLGAGASPSSNSVSNSLVIGDQVFSNSAVSYTGWSSQYPVLTTQVGNTGYSIPLSQPVMSSTLLNNGNQLVLGPTSFAGTGSNAVYGVNAGGALLAATGLALFGTSALGAATGAYNSVYIGNYAGQLAQNVSNNVIIGQNAGKSTSGTGNTFIGYQAGVNLTSGGQNNVFIGNGCTSSTGSNFAVVSNVVIGANAGTALTQSSCTIIGASACTSNPASAYTIAIGYNVQPPSGQTTFCIGDTNFANACVQNYSSSTYSKSLGIIIGGTQYYISLKTSP